MRRALLFLILLLAVALPACSGESAEATCDTPVATNEVELADFEFKPVCVEASAGDTLTLVNTGGAPHTYTVSDSALNVNLDGGESGEVVVDALAAGTYAVRCTYHLQMVGTLKIV